MTIRDSNPDVIVDFITGATIPNVGAEMNRQRVERYLVEEKGYRPEEIRVDAPIQVDIDGDRYESTVDLVVCIDQLPMMAIKCAAGSLGSREREIVSAARLFTASPLPVAVVSDGADATVLDASSGKIRGKGLKAIPSRVDMVALSRTDPLARGDPFSNRTVPCAPTRECRSASMDLG